MWVNRSDRTKWWKRKYLTMRVDVLFLIIVMTVFSPILKYSWSFLNITVTEFKNCQWLIKSKKKHSWLHTYMFHLANINAWMSHICQGRGNRSNEILCTWELGQRNERAGFLVSRSLTVPSAPPWTGGVISWLPAPTKKNARVLNSCHKDIVTKAIIF